MDDLVARGWEQLMGRDDGPMAFRVVVQPVVSGLLAIRAGLRDARAGDPPFLWAAARDRSRRAELLRHGWRDVGRVVLVTTLLDVAYQIAVFRWIHPLQLLIVAFALAIVPYVALRGLANRVARPFLRRQ